MLKQFDRLVMAWHGSNEVSKGLGALKIVASGERENKAA
jgi:hypothetical protein